MNKYFWVGFYLNQNCIFHPDTGRWTLVGYSDGLVVYCVKYGDDGEEYDTIYYDIEEVKFILKKINPFLFLSMGKFYWWIKIEALSGYWMNFDEGMNGRIIFE